MATLSIDNDDIVYLVSVVAAMTDEYIETRIKPDHRENVKFLRDRLIPFTRQDSFDLYIWGT